MSNQLTPLCGLCWYPLASAFDVLTEYEQDTHIPPQTLMCFRDDNGPCDVRLFVGNPQKYAMALPFRTQEAIYVKRQVLVVNPSWGMIADMVRASLDELCNQGMVECPPITALWDNPYIAHITIEMLPGTHLATATINGWLIYLRHVEGMWEAYTAIPEHHIEWRAA